MVTVISSKNVNDLFVKIARELLNHGHINNPRGLETRELDDVWLELTNVSNPIVSLPSRNLNLDYLKGEMEWYKSGSLHVIDIQKYSTFWNKLADSNGTINSNYGFLALIDKFAGKSQLEWCIERLNTDINSRQAIINYNQPRHKYHGNKDFVCTMFQAFVRRNEKLDTIVSMRSNDVIYGLSYDLPWFVHLQNEVSSKTGIIVGKYIHYAMSLHVYKKHYDMIEQMAKEKLIDESTMNE